MHLLPSAQPSEHKNFEDYRRLLTSEMISTLLVLGSLAVVVFWPADIFLYSLQSPLVIGYAKMRLGLLLILAAAYLSLQLSKAIKQWSTICLGISIAIAAVWVSSSLGAASVLTDAPDYRWVYSVYLMPFVSLVLVVPLIERSVLTFGFTFVVLVMLAAPYPDLIRVHFSGSPFVFLTFACLMSCGVGHVLYLMVRAAHTQQWELVRREDFLTKVNNRLEDELARDANKLVDRIREFDAVPNALEEDRKRLARDIHDELGQLLSALRIRVALAQQHVDSPQAVASTFTELDEILDLALSAVRGIVSELRSNPEPLPPLPDRLRQLTQRYERLTDSHCRLEVNLGSLELSPEQHEHLTRIVQECLTNILRHAQATQVEIVVGLGENGLEIAVRDNGQGFDTEAAKAKGHHGLLSLTERAEILGATLNIRSGVDAGTTVSLRLPSDTSEK